MVDLENLLKQLTRFPQGTKAKALSQNLDCSRTTIYEELNALREQGLAYNQNGLWFAKTDSGSNVKPSGFGFWEYLKDRREAKKLEQDLEKKEFDRDLCKLQAENNADIEKCDLREGDPELQEKQRAIEKKWKEHYGLTDKD